MRFYTSFCAISALVLVGSVAESAVGSGRGRPGAVTGVLMQNAQQEQARMPGLDVNNCPGCTTPTPQPPSPPPPPPQPENPCGEVIPMLGVDICVARNACEGIKTDGHSGVFNEATLKCQIPVCAHNWSGIIKKNGEDVCGLVDMGTALRCDANLFDQITAMRRTSQWVTPLMIAGGTGIGAGVGAAIDKSQNKKAAHLATLAYENESAYKHGKGGIAVITFDGRDYELPKMANDLKAALRTNKTLEGKTKEAEGLIDNCASKMFWELVSVDGIENEQKWGRIKISRTVSACKSDDNDYIFCQFQNIHRTTKDMADCAKGDFSKALNINPSYTPGQRHTNPREDHFYWGNGNSTNIADGKCYFRDSQGSGEVNVSATIQQDWARMKFLQHYKSTATGGGDSRSKLKTALSGFNFDEAGLAKSTNATYSGNVANILNWVLVESNGDTRFGDVPRIGTCDATAIDNLLSDEGYLGSASQVAGWKNTTNNILMEAYGALLALKMYGGLDAELEGLYAVLDGIQVQAGAINGIHEGLGDRIKADLGENRPWHKTATARGMLIGGLVGVAGGLTYWGLEGASTFCNVGGFEQVKLNRSYSVPTFREYLLNKGFVGK